MPWYWWAWGAAVFAFCCWRWRVGPVRERALAAPLALIYGAGLLLGVYLLLTR